MFQELLVQSKLDDLERTYRLRSGTRDTWRALPNVIPSGSIEQRRQALITELYSPGHRADVDPGLFSRLVWNGLDRL